VDLIVGTLFLVSRGIARERAGFRFRTRLPLALPVLDPDSRLLIWDEAFAVALPTGLTFLAAADFFPPEREVRFLPVTLFLA
jgi:hypothetical protein